MNNEDLIDYEEVTKKQKPSNLNQNITFNDFLLRDEILQTIKEIGFEHPSEVQTLALPKAILGCDILCQAKSGMGKTAVFVISVLHQLDQGDRSNEKDYSNRDRDGNISNPLISNNPLVNTSNNPLNNQNIKCMVLVNTREMALQIKNEFLRFSKNLKPQKKISAFFGGVEIHSNISDLKENPEIYIGTIGRTLDLLKRNLLNLKNLKFLVVDEADKIISDMKWEFLQIFLKTPKKKQVMFFSATFSDLKFLRSCLKNPVEIFVEESKLILTGLKQKYLKTTDKFKSLIFVLDTLDFNQTLIFVNSTRISGILNDFLNENGFPTVEINSQLKSRDLIMEDFKKMKFRILITTDLLARGIDVSDVNLVVNFDLPSEVETYLHRVGRAGRFDSEGVAVSFLQSERDLIFVNEIQEKYEVIISELK